MMKRTSTILSIVVVIALLVTGCALPTPPPTAPEATPPEAQATAAPTPPAARPVAVAAGPAGRWEGSLTVAGAALRIIVEFSVEEDVLSGTIDIPQQNAAGIPLNNARYEPPRIYFEMLSGPQLAVFDGELAADGIMSGTFTQAGYEGTFQLQQVEVQPAEALPYTEEEVVFPSGEISLAGTLSLPQTEGPHPAVVLISGSGPQDRNEEVFGFQVFHTLADHLTRSGIAVLRYDDRGVGASTGQFAGSTTADFADDTRAALAFLQERADIAPDQIGLLGHSEGGLIATMIAAGSDDVAFVILMAGPALPGAEIVLAQLELILRAEGATEAEMAKTLEQQQWAFEFARTGEGWEEVEALLRQQMQESFEQMTEEQRQQFDDVEGFMEMRIAQQREGLRDPWYRFFLDHDPAPDLARIEVPVLALFGDLDLQVPAEANREVMEAIFEESGNPSVTIQVFPTANHLFQAAITGSPTEYGALEPAFVPGFLELIGDWIWKQVEPAG